MEFDLAGLRAMLGAVGVIVLAQAMVFALVIIGLRQFLLGGTTKALKRLKDAEAGLNKKEEAMRVKMETHEQEFYRKQAESDEELSRQREAAERDITLMKERVVGEAKAQADKIISEAQLNKDKIRDQVVREMDEKTVGFAGELFTLVISKGVNDKLNEAFIEELISALQEVDETSIHVEADDAEFIASHPLVPEQKAKLEELLAQKFSVSLKIEEKIQEDLLAGLIIKLGSLEIDGSLLNRYKEAVAHIKKKV